VAALQGLPGIQVIDARNTRRGLLRYGEALLRLLLVRFRERPDGYILGFRGHEIFWPVRLLTRGKPLILDQMMSPYDSLIRERKTIAAGGILDRMIYAYEKSALQASDLILTDTRLHQQYFIRLFDIPPAKIHPVCMSADETLFHPAPVNDARQPYRFLRVLFYGSFLPLHGMDTILKAADRLRNEAVRFEIIGGSGNNLRRFVRMIRQYGMMNVQHRTWVDYTELPGRIAQADLCLAGPFGNTGQANRIITGKTFQCLAMEKPVVIGEISAEEGFRNRENCLIVPQGNDQALAEAIRWSQQHPEKLKTIGRKGRELYDSRFSLSCIRKDLEEMITRLFPDRTRREASPRQRGGD
jgi:glycosyltransferase involved in cell wall biosynthesis